MKKLINAVDDVVTDALAGKPTFDLGDAEVELGIGIHGEPGRSRGPLRSASELAAVADYVAKRGGRIARNLVGNYITSLEMQGFSVTVCALTPQLTRLWDAPVDTPALRWGR